MTVANVAFSLDGSTVRVWEAATGNELATLISLDAGQDWLMMTPEGYYNASPNGGRFVRWRVGERLFPEQQYKKQFRRPDLVAKSLRGEPLPDPK